MQEAELSMLKMCKMRWAHARDPAATTPRQQ